MADHQSRPIDILPYYKHPSSLARFTALTRVKTEAQQSLGEVDRAIAEITVKVQEVIDCLQAMCREKVEQLQDMKATLAREIPLGLEEVESTLTQESPILNTQFGPLFRELTERTAPLQLFSYTIELCSPLALIRFHPHLANDQKRFPTSLAGVYEDKAFLYDIGTQQITRRTLAHNFGTSGSYAVLDKDTLLCVGANPASSDVYLLDLLSFLLSPLPSLSTPRRAAGVAKVNTHIYVFGGANSQILSSCEKMNLSVKCWTGVRSMNYARGGFTPCQFRALLYLFSCWTHSNRSIETFDPDTEMFTVLPVLLPAEALPGGSVSFVANAELCVLTGEKQLLRWKILTEKQFLCQQGCRLYAHL